MRGERAASDRRLTRGERQAETRRALLHAAEVVFLREGFAGASVEAISAEAGFTRGAFYSNFDSKLGLFVELLQDRIIAGYRRLVERLPADASPEEQLRWGARELMERQKRDQDRWLFELFLECIAHAVRHPELAEVAAGFWRGNRSALADQIERTAESTGAELPVAPSELATAVAALDVGLAIQHLVDPEQVPLELYGRLFPLLLGGLSSGEGTNR